MCLKTGYFALCFIFLCTLYYVVYIEYFLSVFQCTFLQLYYLWQKGKSKTAQNLQAPNFSFLVSCFDATALHCAFSLCIPFAVPFHTFVPVFVPYLCPIFAQTLAMFISCGFNSVLAVLVWQCVAYMLGAVPRVSVQAMRTICVNLAPPHLSTPPLNPSRDEGDRPCA